MTNVDLWIWSLKQSEVRFEDHLATDERARADRFVNPEHGREFVVGRGRLREILAEYIGVSPREIQFAHGTHGKPKLLEGPAFNLSHSGGWAALVVSSDCQDLGVDIEAMRPVEPDVAKRFFSVAERAALTSLKGRAWQQGFFNCWTRKEAVIKAIGLGLSMPLDSFDVSLTPGAPAMLLRLDIGDPRDWKMAALDCESGMAGAIVARSTKPISVVLREGALPLKLQEK